MINNTTKLIVALLMSAALFMGLVMGNMIGKRDAELIQPETVCRIDTVYLYGVQDTLFIPVREPVVISSARKAAPPPKALAWYEPDSCQCGTGREALVYFINDNKLIHYFENGETEVYHLKSKEFIKEFVENSIQVYGWATLRNRSYTITDSDKITMITPYRETQVRQFQLTGEHYTYLNGKRLAFPISGNKIIWE